MEKYKEAYENFLKNHPLCDFQQSIAWGKLKVDWKNELILIHNDKEEIVASMSVLIRKIPMFGNLMYVPRGPVGDIQDKNILEQLTYQVRKLAKTYKAFVIKIEPNVEKSNQAFTIMAKDLGYHIYSDAMNFKQEIQARHNFRLFINHRTKEELFQSFSSKTRYNIRLAQRKGVQIQNFGEEGLDTFYTLLEETGRRDGFRVRKQEYFERLYQVFPKENLQLKIAYYEGKPIAGILLMLYGKKMWYLYGASSNLYRNTMPNYLLQWEAIQLAAEKDFDIYDFRGVSFQENGEADGLFHFKKSFGTQLVELIGEMYIPFKPIRYKLYQLAEKMFRNLRDFVYKRKIRAGKEGNKNLLNKRAYAIIKT
ncbi:MAG: lipid II:glycine glycyltransferase FemX [Clostridia bacterium]